MIYSYKSIFVVLVCTQQQQKNITINNTSDTIHDIYPLLNFPCWPGSLAEWLADHPVMLSGILPMVLQGLVKAELSVSSVSTLKRICRECRHDLGPYAQDILTVSQVRHAASCNTSEITVFVLTPVFLCRMYWWKKSIRWVNSLQRPPVAFLFCKHDSHSVRTSCMMRTVRVSVCLCAEQPVHVVDAGSGFPPVRPAGGGDSGQTSLSHHASRPAAGHTGPAGGTSKQTHAASTQNPTNTKRTTVVEVVVYKRVQIKYILMS